jgi:predicted transcriptional regulator
MGGPFLYTVSRDAFSNLKTKRDMRTAERRKLILSLIKENPGCDVFFLAEKVGISTSSLNPYILDLLTHNFIYQTKDKAGKLRRRYLFPSPKLGE